MKRILTAVLFLLLNASVSADPPTLTDTEPNNTLETAQPFTIGTVITGTLDYTDTWSDDADWYTFTTDLNGALHVLAEPTTSLAIGMELWKAGKTSPSAQVGSWVYEGIRQQLVFPNLAKGTYHLKVVRHRFSSGAYTVTSELRPPTHAFEEDVEPNDSLRTAVSIDLNTPFTGHIGYTDLDRIDTDDWVRFEIPEDGLLDLHAIPDSTLAIGMQLWNETVGQPVRSAGHFTFHGIEQTIQVRELQAGTYHLRLNYAGSYGSYSVIIGYTAGDLSPNDIEPNNTAAQARSIPVNTDLSGRLGFTDGLTTDETDWYRFETQVTGQARIRVTPDSALAVPLQLFTHDLGQLVRSAGHHSFIGLASDMLIEQLSAGTYLLQIGRGQFGSYRMIIETQDSIVVEPEPLLSGRVTNALTGEPIPDALVTVGAEHTVTDADGRYAFLTLPPTDTQIGFMADVTTGTAPLEVAFTSELRDGFHNIQVTAEGFDPFAYGSLVVDGPTIFDLSLSPILVDADLRFVLNWSATPRDLDSHMRTPDGYHVSYMYKGSATEAPYVTLDHDITTGFGPETMTLVSRIDGFYHYYVHNYSQEADITTSQAVVQIYDGVGLLHTLDIPTTGTGLYWYVAMVDGASGRVHILNRIQADEPGGSEAGKRVAKQAADIAADWRYEWTFGDGGTSTEAHPVHTYLQAGTFTVSVTAYSGDRIAMHTRRDLIHVEAPVIRLEAVDDTVRVVAGTIVRIDPLANDRIPDQTPVNWRLDNPMANFGFIMPTLDGTGIIYASVSNRTGVDELRYTLRSDTDTSSAVIRIEVSAGAPRNQAPMVALPVEVTVLEDSVMTIPIRKLVFDDRDAVDRLAIEITSSNPAIQAAYVPMTQAVMISAAENAWGTSLVFLTATDTEDARTTDYMTVTFVPVNDVPVADFELMEQVQTDGGVLVRFRDLSHDALDPEGAVTGWMWTFGDGHHSTDRHAAHTYTASGEYPVTLTITDNGGLTAAKTLPFVVVVTGLETDDAITGFRLHGAYPNPFNPSTSIRFDIPQAGDVVIEVVAMNGQRVAIRQIRGLSAGRHRISLDASRWSSGVYLYTVMYGNEVRTGKMTLIK